MGGKSFMDGKSLLKLFGRWSALGVLCAAPAVWAHHSTAIYDYSKRATITGVVRQWQYTNPHCFIQMLVPDGKGGQVEWSIEAGTVSPVTARLGWNRSVMKPGDRVTALISPMRDGSPGGTLRTLTLPDGRVLNAPTANIEGDATGKPAFNLGLPEIKRATPKQEGETPAK